MASSTNKWIQSAWMNETRKEQTSLKREAERAMRNVNANLTFNEGSVPICEERYTEWKAEWKTVQKILNEGQKRNKQQSLNAKEL